MEELKELVAKTLESKGVLSRIRAELRASVFTAIDEQREEGAYLEPRGKLQLIRNDPQAKLLALLVGEFLSFYGLESTLSVFQCEAALPKTTVSQENMAKQLKVPWPKDGVEDASLLGHIVTLAAGQDSSTQPIPETTADFYAAIDGVEESNDGMEEINDWGKVDAHSSTIQPPVHKEEPRVALEHVAEDSKIKEDKVEEEEEEFGNTMILKEDERDVQLLKDIAARERLHEDEYEDDYEESVEDDVVEDEISDDAVDDVISEVEEEEGEDASFRAAMERAGVVLGQSHSDSEDLTDTEDEALTSGMRRIETYDVYEQVLPPK